MNFGSLKQVATQGLGRGLLIGRKFSPEILTVAGVVGVVAAGVLAARATLKLEPVVDNIRMGVEVAKQRQEEGEGNYQKDITYVYSQGALDLVKLYGPSVTLGAVSIFGILAGHRILSKRNAALAVAYKGLETAFNKYRERVREAIGEDKERELYYDGAFHEIKITHEDDSVETVEAIDVNGLSPYARIFDELSTVWDKNPDYNLQRLRAEQNYVNDMLKLRGHVFLNEVYDRLGLERSEAGSIVGWTFGKGGDNYIDFGIYDPRNHKGLNPTTSRHDGVFILDFNVEGPIYQQLDRKY